MDVLQKSYGSPGNSDEPPGFEQKGMMEEKSATSPHLDPNAYGSGFLATAFQSPQSIDLDLSEPSFVSENKNPEIEKSELAPSAVHLPAKNYSVIRAACIRSRSESTSCRKVIEARDERCKDREMGVNGMNVEAQKVSYDGSPSSCMIPGRYVSKRRRAEFIGTEADKSPETSGSNSEESLVPCSKNNLVNDIPNHIIRNSVLSTGSNITTPNKIKFKFDAHTNAASCVKWSPELGHLLASAGMDGQIKIWKIFSRRGAELGATFTCHLGAVKDVSWSDDSRVLLSAGFDKTVRLIDVETGTFKQFTHEGMVTCVRYFPGNGSLFVSGGTEKNVRCTDLRSGKVEQTFEMHGGRLLDVDFSPDGNSMLMSVEPARKSSMDRNLTVWNINSGVCSQNQIYMGGYSCPCVRFNPCLPFFVAQTNGNYIASFSSKSPFRMNKAKRYQGGHLVEGYPVLCDFNNDGRILATGSSDGLVAFYSLSCSLLKTENVHPGSACVDVKFHPLYHSTVATCSWDGEIAILR